MAKQKHSMASSIISPQTLCLFAYTLPSAPDEVFLGRSTQKNIYRRKEAKERKKDVPNFSTRLAQPSDPLLDLKDGSGDQGSYANHQRDSTDSQDLHESLLEPVSDNQRIENSSQAVSVNPTVKQVLDGILRWPEKKPTTRSRKTEDAPSVMTLGYDLRRLD
ncbi:hypothetical protein DMENIID0001_007400 [Sergentomyia squamirostris]